MLIAQLKVVTETNHNLAANFQMKISGQILYCSNKRGLVPFGHIAQQPDFICTHASPSSAGMIYTYA